MQQNIIFAQQAEDSEYDEEEEEADDDDLRVNQFLFISSFSLMQKQNKKKMNAIPNLVSNPNHLILHETHHNNANDILPPSILTRSGRVHGRNSSDYLQIQQAQDAGIPILTHRTSPCSDSDDQSEEEDPIQIIQNLLIPPPFDRLILSIQHSATMDLLQVLTKLKAKYVEAKSRFTDERKQMYNAYWPKSAKLTVTNNENETDFFSDLLSLEAFRYELHCISGSIDIDKLSHLVSYGLNAINKVQSHYHRISDNSNIYILSWSVVIWLTSALYFVAKHISNEQLTCFCIPILQKVLACHDCIGSTIRRSRHQSMYSSNMPQLTLCKHIKSFIVKGCKLMADDKNKMREKPHFDTFCIYLLLERKEKEIKIVMEQTINSLKHTDEQNDDLPFPWDSAEHLTQTLYVIWKMAIYFVELDEIRWIESMIDGFYQNLCNFPTQKVRILNDIDPIFYQQNFNQFAPNSFMEIMRLYNKLIGVLHEDHSIDYEFCGEEYDVLNEGHRMMDICFFSIYIKQIQSNNV